MQPTINKQYEFVGLYLQLTAHKQAHYIRMTTTGTCEYTVTCREFRIKKHLVVNHTQPCCQCW